MKAFLIGILLLFVPACASLEKPNPGSFNDKFVYAVATAEVVTTSATQLYNRGRLSRENATKIVESLEQVNQLLMVAKATNDSGDTEGALKSLEIVNNILLQLEAQINEVKNEKQSLNHQQHSGPNYGYFQRYSFSPEG